MPATPFGRLTSRSAALLVLLLAVTFAGACDKVPLVAPSGTVITLVSTSNSVPANGSGDIVAVLIESGTQPPATGGTPPATGTPGAGTAVHNGTLVTFTTTLGRIEPQEARTTNGRANVKLIADGRSGVATITAFSGGASRTLAVNVGAAAASRVLVTASPQSLPAAGGTTTITARVEDAQGNGIAAAAVSFSTSAGTLSQGTVTTDDSGSARVILSTTAAATVTASASGGTGTAALSGTVAITVSPNLTFDIAPQSAAATVGVQMTFTLTVGTQVVVSNVVVDFGDGEAASLGAVSSTRTVPHTYASAGSYTATATATTAEGPKSSSTPLFIADYVPTVSCSANAPLGSTSSFTATFPTGMSVSNFVWQFADEHTNSAGASTSHTFQSKGTKVVTVTVVPTKGPARSSSCSLEIT